jgi:hypothetical protein
MRVAVLLLIAGCATVKPYERGLLMSRVMAEPAEPLEAAADQHVLGPREHQRGATRAGGVSCGCK